MSIIGSFKICIFHKYADFKGTANRSEYWWFLEYLCFHVIWNTINRLFSGRLV